MTKKLLSISEILEKYNADKEHTQQVKDYCGKLFDALQASCIINFTLKEKEYLLAASLLHDIGYFIEKKAHHKHSMKLIIENGLDGFDEKETRIIANIARYHRSSEPNADKHKEYAELSQNEQELVLKLSSILRIADGMDKPHKNLIIRISVSESEESINFSIKTVGFKPNLKMAKEKSELFENVFKKRVKFLFV